MIVIGVNCKTSKCENIVAFQELNEAPKEATINPTIEYPFIVKCDVCGESHSYEKDDLGVFELQLPK
jgi:hypothetical protein